MLVAELLRFVMLSCGSSTIQVPLNLSCLLSLIPLPPFLRLAPVPSELVSFTSKFAMLTTPPSTQQTSQTFLVTPRPHQGWFNKEQTAFLKQFHTDYTQYYESLSKVGSGIRGIRGTKGDKSTWVLQNVYPKFVTGPNLESLKGVSSMCFKCCILIIVS